MRSIPEKFSTNASRRNARIFGAYLVGVVTSGSHFQFSIFDATPHKKVLCIFWDFFSQEMRAVKVAESISWVRPSSLFLQSILLTQLFQRSSSLWNLMLERRKKRTPEMDLATRNTSISKHLQAHGRWIQLLENMKNSQNHPKLTNIIHRSNLGSTAT